MIKIIDNQETIRRILTEAMEHLGDTTHFSDTTTIHVRSMPKRTITLELALMEPVPPNKSRVVAIAKQKTTGELTAYVPRAITVPCQAIIKRPCDPLVKYVTPGSN